MKKNNPKTNKLFCLILILMILVCVLAVLLKVAFGKGDLFGRANPTQSPYSTVRPEGTEEPHNNPTETPSETYESTPEQNHTPTPTLAPTPTPTPTVSPEKTPGGNTQGTGPAATHSPDAVQVSKASVLAAGDNLFHNGILKEAMSKAQERGEGDFYFDYIYENVRESFLNADISMINQESLILPKNYLSNNLSKYIRSDGSFVAPGELTDTLLRLGIDVMNKANNHMLDMGSGGMKWGVDYMSTVSEMVAIGAYYDEKDSENIRVIEKNGIRIAFLAYTYDTNVPQWKASSEAPEFPYYVPLLEDDKMISDLNRAKEVSDFIVVTVHWGTELQETPNEEQRRIAKLLAENGAGIIIGHHSHCLQPIEYVDNGKGGKIICAYSLGTLVSNMSSEKNMLSGLLTFDAVKWSDGTVSAENVKLNPTVFYYDLEYKNSRLYYLDEMTDTLCESHGIGNYPKDKEEKNKMTRDTLYAYLQKTISNEFLSDKYKK